MYCKVSDKVYIKTSLEDVLEREEGSICDFLLFLDLSAIAKYVKEKYYPGEDWRFRYPAEPMLKLLAVWGKRQLSFNKTIASVSEIDWLKLGFKEGKHPCGGALHHFIKYRLGVEGLNEVMLLLGKEMAGISDSKILRMDSTPLEASRYNEYADYNPYYECLMDKAHITMLGTCPLYMTHTGGNAGDSPELPRHLRCLGEMGVDVNSAFLDGAYDSFLNHAMLWYTLKAWPYIYPGEDAVQNEEGTLERIGHWCNRLWKDGGSVHAKLEDKLRFLYEHGREEQVGAYFRNLNLLNPAFDEIRKLRGECERIHGHMKDTLKFDIRRLRKRSREVYTLARFVVYQLLVLAKLQNGLDPVNGFGCLL